MIERERATIVDCIVGLWEQRGGDKSVVTTLFFHPVCYYYMLWCHVPPKGEVHVGTLCELWQAIVGANKSKGGGL